MSRFSNTAVALLLMLGAVPLLLILGSVVIVLYESHAYERASAQEEDSAWLDGAEVGFIVGWRAARRDTPTWWRDDPVVLESPELRELLARLDRAENERQFLQGRGEFTDRAEAQEYLRRKK